MFETNASVWILLATTLVNIQIAGCPSSAKKHNRIWVKFKYNIYEKKKTFPVFSQLCEVVPTSQVLLYFYRNRDKVLSRNKDKVFSLHCILKTVSLKKTFFL